MEQMGEQQPGRPPADDAHLCAHPGLKHPRHFRDQIILGYPARPVSALVEIMPDRPRAFRAIENHLFVDGVVLQQVLIERAYAAAQHIGKLEIVGFVQLVCRREFDLQQAPAQVVLKKIILIVEIGFPERRGIEQNCLMVGQCLPLSLSTRRPGKSRRDRWPRARPQHFHTGAFLNQLAVTFGHRFYRFGEPGQPIRPVPFPFRGQSKQCAPSLSQEYSVPAVGSIPIVADPPA